MASKIHYMNHEEIVALTDADLRRMVNLAMAEEGIPVLDEPVPPQLPALPIDDTVAFTAKCLHELCFTDREEALKILDAIRGCRSTTRVYNDYSIKGNRAYPGFTGEYDNGQDAYDLRSVSARSVAQMQVLREQISARNKVDADFQKLADAYKKAQTAAKGIREEIYGTYEEHKAQDRRRDGLQGKLQQYLELAEGSVEVALRFLGKVEELTEEDVEMLRAAHAAAAEESE